MADYEQEISDQGSSDKDDQRIPEVYFAWIGESLQIPSHMFPIHDRCVGEVWGDQGTCARHMASPSL